MHEGVKFEGKKWERINRPLQFRGLLAMIRVSRLDGVAAVDLF
jgi:hypothetical protein